jgi:hypothetical protein
MVAKRFDADGNLRILVMGLGSWWLRFLKLGQVGDEVTSDELRGLFGFDF